MRDHLAYEALRIAIARRRIEEIDAVVHGGQVAFFLEIA